MLVGQPRVPGHIAGDSKVMHGPKLEILELRMKAWRSVVGASG